MKKYLHLLPGILISVLVIGWNCRNIGMCHQPILFQDEAGYWTHAAFFAGQDWSGISGGLIWYSYGYSFLLSILMRLIHGMTAQYQAALVMNAVMLGAVFWIFWRILRKLFPAQNQVMLYLPALAGVCYAPYQIYSLTTWSEILILLIFSLITLFLFSMLERASYWKINILGLLCSYCYMVHNRCIGLIIAVCMIILISMGSKKISIWQGINFFCMLGIGMLMHVIIKHFLITQLWEGSLPSANDAGTVTQRFLLAFSSWKGFRLWLSIFISQGFSGMISGFCLPVVAFIAMITRLCCIRKKFSNQDLQNIYFLLSFFLMLSISSIFMITYDRIDHIIYTRYIDCTLGLAMSIGICVLLEKQPKEFFMILVIAVPLMLYLGAERASVLADHLEADIFNKLCAPFQTGYYEEYHADFFHYGFQAWLPGVAAVCIALLFRKHSIPGGVLISALLIIFSVSHTQAGMIQIRQSQKAQDAYMDQLMSFAIPDDSIYILSDIDSFPYLVQMQMQEKHVICVKSVSEIPEHAFFLCDMKNYMLYHEYQFQDNSDSFLLFQKAKGDHSFPLRFMSVFDASAYDPKRDNIISIDTSQVLCYGPYVTLMPGRYEFEFLLTISEAPETADLLGVAEIRSGNEIYAHTEISRENMPVRLTVRTKEMITNTEFVIALYDPANVILKLHGIKIRYAAA